MPEGRSLAVGALLVLPVAVIASVVFVRRSFCIVYVSGTSMHPALREGQRLLVRRGSAAGLRRGDIVVAAGPRVTIKERGDIVTRQVDWQCSRRKWIVKRVAYLAGEEVPEELFGPASKSARTVSAGHVFLLGDNGGESLDSRYFGCVPLDAVLGVVRSF